MISSDTSHRLSDSSYADLLLLRLPGLDLGDSESRSHDTNHSESHADPDDRDIICRAAALDLLSTAARCLPDDQSFPVGLAAPVIRCWHRLRQPRSEEEMGEAARGGRKRWGGGRDDLGRNVSVKTRFVSMRCGCVRHSTSVAILSSAPDSELCLGVTL